MSHEMKTYRSRIVPEEERLVGKHIRENLKISAPELGHLFRGMHAHTLRLHLLCAL